jgi:hypothetical protein
MLSLQTMFADVAESGGKEGETKGKVSGPLTAGSSTLPSPQIIHYDAFLLTFSIESVRWLVQ